MGSEMCIRDSGNITEDAIKKYIQEQSDESRKEENKGNTGLQKYFDVD